MADDRSKRTTEVIDKPEQEVERPVLFRVILHNDDYTTMDFVVRVVETVFNKQPAEAFRIMMQVHTTGRAVCGIYPFDVAETRASAVHELAQENGFPLRAAVEKAEA